MIGFIASAEVKIDTQILCSLSPYFAEDLKYARPWWLRALGRKRVSDFKSIKSDVLAKKIKTRTIMLLGSEEVEEIKRSNKRIYPLLRTKKEHYYIDQAKHQIEHPNYQKKIQDTIKKL
jgi:hypothetical protein